MKNRDQCKHGLLYNEFSIILIQTFCSPKIEYDVSAPFLELEEKGNIDDQLFIHHEKIVDRYKLQGFDIRIELDEPGCAVLEGHVHVRGAVFFDSTVQISYRIIIPAKGQDHFCRISEPFNTDRLIAVAGIVQHVEHWIFNEKDNRQEIDGSLKSVIINKVHLTSASEYSEAEVDDRQITFDEIQRRYRRFFDKSESDDFYYPDHNYTFIDIWETLGHQGNVNFSHMYEDEIIEHIEKKHKAELLGLMTLYPEEWPYRMGDSFEDVCGKNVAIDTDDLVLANENVSLVFGTYGKRGEEAPTNWKEHLQRRDRYHVSWPEYFVILEILLAKKYTVNYVLNKYIHNSMKEMEASTWKKIDRNAKLSIKLSYIILQLDSVRYLRYMSHKHMYRETTKRLKINEDEKQLEAVMKRVDKSLNNANNAAELKEANEMKYILFFISFASLFGVLLAGNGEVPVYSMISRNLGVGVAVCLVALTSVGILYGLVVAIKVMLKCWRKTKI